MNKDPKENKYGVKFSELHAIDLVDMDGDGLKDIVTGKRFWSHGRTGDPDRNDAAVLYWFKLVRGADKRVDFVPHLIDNDSGVGTQVVATDVNGDGLPDVVVGNKKGAFVHLQKPAGPVASLTPRRGLGQTSSFRYSLSSFEIGRLVQFAPDLQTMRFTNGISEPNSYLRYVFCNH